MSENNHTLGIKIPEYRGYCAGLKIYIDGEYINNTIRLDLPDESKRITENSDEMNIVYNVAILEIASINEIARLMNEENFDKFCKLWRIYHKK